MKKLNKMLAVVLSLVLCATMVAPAFAASFSELQGVIDNKTSLKDENDNVRIDYTDGTVTLNESVERGEDETNKSIIIDAADGQVTIDLNGKKINGNDEESQHAVIEVKGGDLTIQDSTAKYDEEAQANLCRRWSNHRWQSCKSAWRRFRARRRCVRH